jgi:hypothetical protein
MRHLPVFADQLSGGQAPSNPVPHGIDGSLNVSHVPVIVPERIQTSRAFSPPWKKRCIADRTSPFTAATESAAPE